MASLNDIPFEIRTPEAKNRFITWVKLLKVDPYVKRELIAKWILATGVRLSFADYEFVGL
jgi:hypothetical protein